jgi:hypothetical protein
VHQLRVAMRRLRLGARRGARLGRLRAPDDRLDWLFGTDRAFRSQEPRPPASCITAACAHWAGERDATIALRLIQTLDFHSDAQFAYAARVAAGWRARSGPCEEPAVRKGAKDVNYSRGLRSGRGRNEYL